MKKKILVLNSLVIIFILLLLLTSCNSNIEKNKVTKENTRSENSIIREIDKEEDVNEKVLRDSEKIEADKSFDQYTEKISSIEDFNPHFKTAFRFENLEEKNDSHWQEKVRACLDDINKEFDYFIFKNQSLSFVGNYKGEDKFLEYYVDSDEKIPQVFKPVKNEPIQIQSGKIYHLSLIKGYSMSKSLADMFSNDIAEGRNFVEEDFFIKSIDEPIKVILGHNYKDIYEIGDSFEMGKPEARFTYEVIGFYKPGVNIISDYASAQETVFDNYIIAPHYLPTFTSENPDLSFEIDFQIGSSLDGYIKIEEPMDKISPELFESYEERLNKILLANDLEKMISFAYFPADLRKKN